MFGLIPTFTNNLASRDNSFKSIFDVFNEPFFQNAFAPVNSMFNAFKVDVKDTDNAYELTAELPGLTYSPCLKAGDSWIQTILAY